MEKKLMGTTEEQQEPIKSIGREPEVDDIGGELKEVVQVQDGKLKLMLGSTTTGIKDLCVLALQLKDEWLKNNGQEKPGESYIR